METNRMGRLRLFASLALVGFFVGVLTYSLFSWLASFMTLPVTSIPLYIPKIFVAPWFLSGLAGSIFTIVLVTIIAYVTANKG